jgi:endonuclease/exonuclease/phosphatase (EEP) superfamily protein YafD
MLKKSLLSFLILGPIFIGTAKSAALIEVLNKSSSTLEVTSPAKNELKTSCFDVLSWNIHKASKKKKYKAFIEQYIGKTDIVMIQEAKLRKVVVETMGNFNDFGFIAANTFLLNGKRTGGVATGSYAKSIESRVAFSRKELRVATPKVALITKYKIAGQDKELIVANIHAINFVGKGSFKKHIEKLFKYLNEIKKENSAILIAGDFNSWTTGRVNFLNTIMKENGLSAVYTDKNDGRVKAPFISKFKKYDYPLDHVFIKGLKIISKEVVEESAKASDHKALYFNVCLE